FSWNAIVPIWGDGSSLYVSIPTAGTTIYKVDLATGQYAAFASLPEFSPVQSLWADKENLYAASIYTIHRISLSSGQVSLIAGRRETPFFSLECSSGQAGFRPHQVIFGNRRYFDFIHRGFYATRIRRLDLTSGEVTTTAGAWGITGTEDGLGPE